MLGIYSLLLLSIVTVNSNVIRVDGCTNCIEFMRSLADDQFTATAQCNPGVSFESCQQSKQLLSTLSRQIGVEETCSIAQRCKLLNDGKARSLIDMFFPTKVIANTTKAFSGMATGTVDIANVVAQSLGNVLSDQFTNVPLVGGFISGILSGATKTAGGVSSGITSIVKGTTDGIASFFDKLG